MKLVYRRYIYENSLGGKPSQNSLGEPIHSTPEGIQNFWRWFGDSVTVDNQGRPIVYFHGSYGDFEEFQLEYEREDYDPDSNYSDGWDGGNLGHGHYFTDDFNYAKRFGSPKKYYLKILNLYDLTNEANIEELNNRFKEEKDDLIYSEYGELIENEMKRGGYDGVIGKGVGGFSYGASEVMVLKSNQIKAVENTGTFEDSGKFKVESVSGNRENQIGRKLSETNPSKSHVFVYRACKEPIFHRNDYVTLSPKFAIEHAESNHVVEQETQYVIRRMFKSSEIAEATNPGEYFYIGKDVPGSVVYVTKGPEEYEGDIPNLAAVSAIKI